MESEFITRPKLNAESVIISNYIRYETLLEMNKAFTGSTSNVVDVYIDLYEIFLRMYRSDVMIGDRSTITSTIINLCSHYRSFYRKFYDVHARIFLVCTSGSMEFSRMYLSEYNSANEILIESATYITKIINQSKAILSELTKYIYDVYFIQAPFEAHTLIYSTITNRLSEGIYDPCVIISKNPLTYVIPSLVPNDVYVFRHKWTDGGITFKVIGRDNAIACYLDGLKMSESTIAMYSGISSQLLLLIIALNRLPSRSLKGINNTRSVAQLINEALQDGMINAYFYDDNHFAKDPILMRRYKAIDIIMQSNIYQNSAYYDMSWNVNLQNPEMVKEINDRYFRYSPLDLERL